MRRAIICLILILTPNFFGCHLSISTQISKLKYQYSQIASDFHFLQAVCRALKSRNFVEQFLFPLFEFSFKRQGLTFGETVFFP